MSGRNIMARWVVGMITGILVSIVSPIVSADGLIRPDGTDFKGYYITGKAEWEKLKTELPPNERVQALNPNFAKTALIVVTWGEKPSAGYEIAIGDVLVEGAEATVKVRLTAPAPDELTAAVLTYPVDLKVVDLATMAGVTRLVFRDENGGDLAQIALTPTHKHTVQNGESLWQIARAFGRRTHEQIMDFIHQVFVWNALTDADSIRPGQELVVPGRVDTPAWVEREDMVFYVLRERIGPEVIGYGFGEDSAGQDPEPVIWVLAASPRMTALKQARLRDDAAIRIDQVQDLVSYTATGPWVRDANNEIVADVRDISGASAINYLSLSPDGKYLAVAARGYQNLLLLWDCEVGRFHEIARYPSELVTKVAWSSDSQQMAVELSGAWGRTRLVGYNRQGERLAWGLETRWPAGYILTDPRWLATRPVLSFEVQALGLALTAGELTGRWLFDPADGSLRPADSPAELL